MTGWAWIGAGLVLALLELVTPAWIFLGTAIGVAAVGVAVLTGLWTGGLAWSLVLAAILSAAAWWGLKRCFAKSDQRKVWRDDINDNSK